MHKTIMIVDDDDALRDNLQDILSDEGYLIYTAANCAEALLLASVKKPRVALLDLKLPDDSGANLLCKLKQFSPDCMCALMTAFADVDSAITALDKGAFHYLQKPVRPIELFNLLERIFETLQIREEKRLAEEKLRESEKRFRTIFETAQDAIFLKEKNLTYTLVNPVMQRLYGIDAARFLGRTDAELFGDKVGMMTSKTEERVIQGEIVEEEEVHWIDGIPKTFHSIRVPLTGNDGGIYGLCGFSRDLTAVRQLEAQLLQSQKMEAIGTLAGGISHDFNNLLQAIMGYTQILLIDKDSQDAEFGKLKEIEKAAQRAADLTRQLLAFARKMEINSRPLDINQVVRQVEKLLNRTIPKMIHIELRLTESVFTVVADPGQLEQVLLNIGLNARDAMPEGGCLTIATANVIPDDIFRKIHSNNGSGPYVQICMSDTGHGMSEEIIERIFDPFFTTKKIGQGTGLGLSMAYGIIKNHRGHIVCQSTPDMGTTFSIYLPAIDITVASELATPEKPIEQGLNETVLVIDDEHYLRDLALEILTPNGYTVLTAASGEEGLSVYRQNATHIAMVLLDLIMPGMGGKQCLSEILKINPQAKVLISSGYTMDSPNRDDILRRAAGFIQKPYHFRDMLQKIREVIVDRR